VVPRRPRSPKTVIQRAGGADDQEAGQDDHCGYFGCVVNATPIEAGHAYFALADRGGHCIRYNISMGKHQTQGGRTGGEPASNSLPYWRHFFIADRRIQLRRVQHQQVATSPLPENAMCYDPHPRVGAHAVLQQDPHEA
jgi:hypothetical protein